MPLSDIKEVTLCKYCAFPDEEYSADEIIEHLARMIEDTSLLWSLRVIHNDEYALERYITVGGLLHIRPDDPQYGWMIEKGKGNDV